MRVLNLVLGIFPFVLVLVSGCESPRQSMAYSPPTVPPTSARPDVRVYSAPPPPVITEPPSSFATPPPVADPDVALAQSISQLLKGEPGLASISCNVEARVNHGFVTLRGTVPTENDRELIKDRVSKLPGVARVTDELGVDLR